MQQVSRFFRQLLVLTGRNFQLIWNNKLVLASLVLQAPLMVGVIFLVGDPDCITSNLIDVGSRTVLFILAAVSAFMGLLNSYREICKEREIIFREASVGVSLGATVLAKALTLFLVAAVQAAILTVGFVRVIHVPQNDLLLDTDWELYISRVLRSSRSRPCWSRPPSKAANPPSCSCWCSLLRRWCSAGRCSRSAAP